MQVRSGRRAESELTERQRHWLGHIRAAGRLDGAVATTQS